MTQRMAIATVVACLTLTAGGRSATAQDPAPAAAAAVPGQPGAVVATESAAEPAEVARYGLALRMPRWVSIPKWFLNFMTLQNKPLSTFNSFGAEFFRRKGNLDIALGFTYQNMTPEDGNWLGKGKNPVYDTDYVQARGLGIVGVDAAFIWRTYLNENFSLHYGGGLGLAFVRGEVLRTSNSSRFCNADNAGDYPACRPDWCSATGCTDEQFRNHQGSDGTDDLAKQFKDQTIPGAIPILQMVFGVDFRLPSLPGFEARFQGGFYDAFFLGMGFGYLF